MNDVKNLGSTEMFVARQASKASIVFGVVLSVLGIFAIITPLFTGIAVTVLAGMLMLAAGIIEISFVFKAGSFGKGILRFIFGGLGILAGIVIIAVPERSLPALTYILAVFFVIGGGINITLALNTKPEEGWVWLMFTGIISIILGALIIAQWPVSGIWAVGFYVGIRMLMHGWMLMALGRTGQEGLIYLQDSRIDMLENQVREGTLVLQETQAQLADNAAMLLAMNNELRKKVSSSEIDPSIQDLNKKLGEARKCIQDTTSATQESWNKTQNEAGEAFKKLSKSSADVISNLKKDLGL